MRSNTTQRNHWTQIGIGACALLLPPLTLGAAFYSMLAAPEEGTAHPAGARVSDPVPVQVTVGPSARANEPLPANTERTPAGSPAASLRAELLQSAPAEVSTALLPRPLTLAGKAPQQIQPPRMMTTQTPDAQTPVATDLPPSEGSPAASPTATKPAHPSNQANRTEAPVVRRNARAHRQSEFSLKNWLQQLGILPRNTRG